MGVKAIKGYSTFPKARGFEPRHQTQFRVISGTLVSRGLTILRRCYWCILQPHLTRLQANGWGYVGIENCMYLSNTMQVYQDCRALALGECYQAKSPGSKGLSPQAIPALKGRIHILARESLFVRPPTTCHNKMTLLGTRLNHSNIQLNNSY